MFKEIGSFVITKQQRERYKAGELWSEWLEKYPDLFDEKDRQFFRNQAVFGYGFVETLSIIFLFNATGYIPIFGAYGLSTHQAKNDLVKQFLPNAAWDLVTYNGSQPMPPDVFAYAPDKSDYFFCEVKGPGDRLRDTQIQHFQALQAISGKPVYTIKYRFAPFSK